MEKGKTAGKLTRRLVILAAALLIGIIVYPTSIQAHLTLVPGLLFDGL